MSNSAAIQKASWKLEGDYFEGCNCDIVCPCIFLSDPDEGNCYVTCAWHIRKGNYENITLDNLNVVAMFHSPGNMVTGPKWKVALYIDDKASVEQTDALRRIYSGQAGGFFAAVANFIGEILGIKSVTIEFGVDGKRRWLYIKNSVELEIEGIKGIDSNKESYIVNPAFTVVPSINSKQGSRYIKRRMGDELKMEYLARNGIISEQEIKQKPSVHLCPRCELVNAIDNKYCSKCSYPLTPQAFEDIKTEENKRWKVLEEKQKEKDNDILEMKDQIQMIIATLGKILGNQNNNTRSELAKDLIENGLYVNVSLYSKDTLKQSRLF